MLLREFGLTVRFTAPVQYIDPFLYSVTLKAEKVCVFGGPTMNKFPIWIADPTLTDVRLVRRGNTYPYELLLMLVKLLLRLTNEVMLVMFWLESFTTKIACEKLLTLMSDDKSVTVSMSPVATRSVVKKVSKGASVAATNKLVWLTDRPKLLGPGGVTLQGV
jgi:hypothetical protein